MNVDSVRACSATVVCRYRQFKAGMFPAKRSCVGVTVSSGCCKFTCILYVVMKLTLSVFTARNRREAYILELEVLLQLPITALNHRDSSLNIWCC